MPFKNGDFILIDYTAKVKETGEVIETTLEDVAKKEGIYRKEKKYEPLLVIIGEGRVVKGLEEALKEMNEGEEKTIEVPPEKAYGVRDPTKLRRMPLREFKKADIQPIPGKVVEINGVPAVIRDVSGGRVLVDFNHPLAGKTIVYYVKVVKHLKSDEEKIKMLLNRRLKPKDINEFTIILDKDKGVVEIIVPESEMLNPDIQLAKKALAREIFKYIDWAREVIYKEVLRTEKKVEKKSEAKESGEEQGKASKESEEQ